MPKWYQAHRISVRFPTIKTIAIEFIAGWLIVIQINTAHNLRTNCAIQNRFLDVEPSDMGNITGRAFDWTKKMPTMKQMRLCSILGGVSKVSRRSHFVHVHNITPHMIKSRKILINMYATNPNKPNPYRSNLVR